MLFQMIFYFYFLLFDVYQLYENIYQSTLSMVSPTIHNFKIYEIDGQYLCKTINDHYILCLQETHHHHKKYIHKFQMCKEDGFTNLKFDYTWQLDLLTNLGFIKSINPKHVIFLKSCKLYHIPYVTTTNYVWMFSITLVRCNPIVWRAPSMCAWHVEQFFVPLYLGHTCHGSLSQMTSWLNFPQNILHPNHHPIWHLPTCPLNMFQTQSCGVFFNHLSRGTYSSWFVINKKILGQPTNTLYLRWWHFGPLQTYNDGITSCKRSTSPQSHMLMYTTFSLFNKKMQHNVAFRQVVVPNSIMMYYIHNVYECPWQLHIISSKRWQVMFALSYLTPPCHNKIWLSTLQGNLSIPTHAFATFVQINHFCNFRYDYLHVT